MATITWALEADFDRDTTYEADLTGYIEHPGAGVRISRGVGRDGRPQASKFTVVLSNRDGAFTPQNGESPFFGLLVPGVPVRLTATHNAVARTIWTGYAMQWRCSWQQGAWPVCSVSCEDIFWFLQNRDPVNVTASTSRDTDEALVAIMDALGLTADDRDFDDGIQVLPMHFAVGQEPAEAMMAVVASELGGLLYPDALGRIRFEARNSRLGTAIDDTWGDGTAILPVAVEYDLNPMEVYTHVTARSTRFRTGQDETKIFEVSENMFTKPAATSRALAAGEVYERTFQANSAFYGAIVTPEAVYDYTANDAQNGTGTDRTGLLEVTVTDLGSGRFRLRWRNTHSATIYVTKFQLRGTPVEFFADRAEAVFSKGVPGLKAGKSLQFDVPFAGDTGQKLRDYAYQELRVGRYAWPVVRLAFKAAFDDEIAALLDADLGHLIRFGDLDAELHESARVDDWWYIEALDYQVPPDWGGEVFDVKVTLVPSYVYRNLDAIVFDTFDRADASGDLGTAFSGDVWADDTGFDISGGYAVPNSTGLQVPNLVVA